jgi:GNAT superfamily N-acetyltransferase
MIVIRRGDRLDVPFLRSLLAHAYSRPVNALELEHPAAVYVDNWGRRGDNALVAMDGGHSVGAGWYRLFSADAHGYGYVDEHTPELTIAVVPSRRGEGIGEQLVEALLARAREEGHRALSVALERDAPERTLLEANGFAAHGEEGVMVTLWRQLD